MAFLLWFSGLLCREQTTGSGRFIGKRGIYRSVVLGYLDLCMWFIFQYHDGELKQLWPQLCSKIPGLFEGIVIEPALLHGDLWSGNVGESEDGPGKC